MYNQDGSVVQTWEGEGQSTYTYLFDQNGNMTTIINPDEWDGNTEKNYTYDNKNNPFKNVLGHSFYIWLNPLDIGGFNNNVISLNGVSWSYSYDSNNYPLTIYTSGMLGSAAPNDWDYASNINATITYKN